MAPSKKVALEKEDHARDAAFMKALHGKSTEATGGFSAILSKNKEAQKLAVDEYYKHFDNKHAETETDADREVCSPPAGAVARRQPMLTSSIRRGQRNMPPLQGSKLTRPCLELAASARR
jgi:sterol 24-C-methyltransferase